MDTSSPLFKITSQVAAFALIAVIAWASYAVETSGNVAVSFRLKNEGKFLEAIRGRKIILSVENSSREDIGSTKFTFGDKFDFFPHRPFYRNCSHEIELTDKLPEFQPEKGETVKIGLEFISATGKKGIISREVKCE